MTERSDPGPATRREIFSWMLFDFANSSYTTLIVTVAYSVYFSKSVVGEEGDGPLLWGVATFSSEALVVLTAPVIGAIADYAGIKKRLLFLTFVACVITTACLGLVGPGAIALGMGLFIVSNLFYSSGENLIAAFLPEIARPEAMGRMSGFGWAIGYAGGMLSLAACYPLLMRYFRDGDTEAMRISFVVVAIFFAVGGIPTFLYLRERARPKALPANRGYVGTGFSRVLETLSHVRRHRQLFRFLLVFLVYNAGVQIVIKFANIYADSAIGLGAMEMMIFFMVVQVSAALGAFAFGYLQDRTTARTAIIVSLFIWLAVCVGAFLTTTAVAFYVVGNLAGIAMGSAQSGARALVGTFSPPERSGEFFGFWGLAWKLSAGVGPLAFGIVTSLVGLRPAILVTGVFFAFGIVGMFWVDEVEGRKAALGPSEEENGRPKTVDV